jgi:hypothetical protein
MGRGLFNGCCARCQRNGSQRRPSELGLVEVAAVEDDRRGFHGRFHGREVGAAVGLPLGHDDQRVGARQGFERLVGEADALQALVRAHRHQVDGDHAAGLSRGNGVVGMDAGPGAQQRLN